MLEEFVENYKKDLVSALDKIEITKIDLLIKEIKKNIKNNKNIFMIGNGGSAANCSHSAGDWSKEIGSRTICLTDNISSLTAWSNDTNYDNALLSSLKTYMNKGDLVIGYSGSGNSQNIINAITWAKQNGAKTFGVTGNYIGLGGGDLKKLADNCIVFDTQSMEVIEDMQLIINHMIKNYIK